MLVNSWLSIVLGGFVVETSLRFASSSPRIRSRTALALAVGLLGISHTSIAKPFDGEIFGSAVTMKNPKELKLAQVQISDPSHPVATKRSAKRRDPGSPVYVPRKETRTVKLKNTPPAN
jgi:hypothetical protein